MNEVQNWFQEQQVVAEKVFPNQDKESKGPDVFATPKGLPKKAENSIQKSVLPIESPAPLPEEVEKGIGSVDSSKEMPTGGVRSNSPVPYKMYDQDDPDDQLQVFEDNDWFYSNQDGFDWGPGWVFDEATSTWTFIPDTAGESQIQSFVVQGNELDNATGTEASFTTAIDPEVDKKYERAKEYITVLYDQLNDAYHEFVSNQLESSHNPVSTSSTFFL